VLLEDDTVWLNQEQMGALFEKSTATIAEHISNIFKEGELQEDSVVRNFRTTASDHKIYNVTFYNLEVIISVGYHVKSVRGTQFRIWATAQNKMHYAVHGQTAAEMIAARADATKPLMGLVNFKGDYITAQDVKVAKNYLTEKELNQLNLIVSLYLDFAEFQATSGKLMTMQDWIAKLDDFLKISNKELLTHAGSISADAVAQKAEDEFKKYRIERDKKNGVGF
jgi:hypothetical protein